jgi:hypothetical protein
LLLGKWVLLYRNSVYTLLFRNTTVAYKEGDLEGADLRLPLGAWRELTMVPRRVKGYQLECKCVVTTCIPEMARVVQDRSNVLTNSYRVGNWISFRSHGRDVLLLAPAMDSLLPYAQS